MAVLEDLRDFIYTELPERPVLIKGASAVGDPIYSNISKVNNAPIGTLYLRDDVVPRTVYYKYGTSSTEQKIISGDGTSSSVNNLQSIFFSLNSKNTNNRYLNFVNNIPSSLMGYYIEDNIYIKKITIGGKNTYDATVILFDNDLNILYEFVNEIPQKIHSIDVNIFVSNGKQISVFLKSTITVDLPIVRLDFI